MACSRSKVVLCADDFGLSDGVSAGILDLAERGRISATSVMTNRPAWHRFASNLRPHQGRIGIGLHFALTGGAPVGPMPRWAPDHRLPGIGEAITRALGGRAPLDEIETELERQLARFEEEFGRGPDFVDGHQHVHALPGIRQRLFRVLARRAGERPWLRDPSARLRQLDRATAGKGLLVRALSAGFRTSANRAGFATNDGFSGFSAFDREPDAAALFERAFRNLGPRPLVMCHPGRPEDGPAPDELVESRPREWAYLRSPAFGSLLDRLGIALVPRPGGGG